ncbi:DUF938 domain-containing protein [Kiloniella sp. b19]|uniref:DUF938 domain-containing protein n=1 Tax=Kiloniella sp. GXU_MW_B19 TaxID=3141326 RepID=UPI0031DB796E
MVTKDNTYSEEAFEDLRLSAPAAVRNRDVILPVLRDLLPKEGSCLEIASGTGEHAAHFAPALAPLGWQASEREGRLLQSIDAHLAVAREQSPFEHRRALLLDLLAEESWDGVGCYDAIFSANMTHIAHWDVTRQLFRLSEQCLKPGGLLLLYGPFFWKGREAVESNLNFDLSLRQRNEDWGIRYFEDLNDLARESSLTFRQERAMPANNFVLVYERQA